MARWLAYLYAGLAWAFVAGVVLQIFLAGLGLFVGSENFALHTTFGWILHLAPNLVLLAAALGGAGRRQIALAIALAITVWIVPILAAVRHDLPLAAAFHPLGAVLTFWLAIIVARGALNLARGREAAQPTTVRLWVVTVAVVVILVGLTLGGPSTA